MNKEAMEAKAKVRAVYPDAVFYRGVGGFDSVILNTNKRPWFAISEPNNCGDEDAAWIDAASRLPARPAKEKICKHCGPTCIPGAAHNARAEDGVIWKPEDDLPVYAPCVLPRGISDEHPEDAYQRGFQAGALAEDGDVALYVPPARLPARVELAKPPTDSWDNANRAGRNEKHYRTWNGDVSDQCILCPHVNDHPIHSFNEDAPPPIPSAIGFRCFDPAKPMELCEVIRKEDYDAALKEIARLTEIVAELRDVQGQNIGIRGSWKFEWERAEKAEAALAQRDEEIVRLGNSSSHIKSFEAWALEFNTSFVKPRGGRAAGEAMAARSAWNGAMSEIARLKGEK